MDLSTSRAAARLAVPVLLALLVVGCANQTATSTAASTTAASTTTVAPTTTVPPLDAKELAWLKAVTRLQKKVIKVFTATGEVFLTRAKMTEYMNTLRSCNRELARIGSPSDRLQPVYVLVKKACRIYDKGAKCFAKAISVSAPGGGVTEANVRTFERSINCGHEAQGDGSNLLADAEEKGKAIRAKAG